MRRERSDEGAQRGGSAVMKERGEEGIQVK